MIFFFIRMKKTCSRFIKISKPTILLFCMRLASPSSAPQKNSIRHRNIFIISVVIFLLANIHSFFLREFLRNINLVFWQNSRRKYQHKAQKHKTINTFTKRLPYTATKTQAGTRIACHSYINITRKQYHNIRQI